MKEKLRHWWKQAISNAAHSELEDSDQSERGNKMSAASTVGAVVTSRRKNSRKRVQPRRRKQAYSNPLCKEVRSILHLPLLQRLTHIKARRTLLAFVLGAAIMLLATFMMKHEFSMIPGMVWEAGTYLLHAIGAIPAVKYFEPFFLLIMGEE